MRHATSSRGAVLFLVQTRTSRAQRAAPFYLALGPSAGFSSLHAFAARQFVRQSAKGADSNGSRGDVARCGCLLVKRKPFCRINAARHDRSLLVVGRQYRRSVGCAFAQVAHAAPWEGATMSLRLMPDRDPYVYPLASRNAGAPLVLQQFECRAPA